MSNPPEAQNPRAGPFCTEADGVLAASWGFVLSSELSPVWSFQCQRGDPLPGADLFGPRVAFQAPVVLLPFVLGGGGESFCAASDFPLCFCPQSLSSRATCIASTTRKTPRKSRQPSRCSQPPPQAASRTSSLTMTTPP